MLDFTGTGNSLNIMHPRTIGLIMDSLRYWVTDMHVDGFRFDLAPVLVRGYEDQGGPPSAFFEIVQQDPVLSTVKLIAEPWDVGPDGYQLGRFPQGWSEWNGSYRDSDPQVLAGRSRAWSRRSRHGCPARATSSRRAVVRRTPASTSSPATTASR